MTVKKIINNGADAVDEMLAGILAAHPNHLKRVEGTARARARSAW